MHFVPLHDILSHIYLFSHLTAIISYLDFEALFELYDTAHNAVTNCIYAFEIIGTCTCIYKQMPADTISYKPLNDEQAVFYTFQLTDCFCLFSGLLLPHLIIM